MLGNTGEVIRAYLYTQYIANHMNAVRLAFLCVTQGLLYCRNSIVRKIHMCFPDVRTTWCRKEGTSSGGQQVGAKAGWCPRRLEDSSKRIKHQVHVMEIQLDAGRNGSQTAEVFKDRGVETRICQRSTFQSSAKEAPERKETNNPKGVWVAL